MSNRSPLIDNLRLPHHGTGDFDSQVLQDVEAGMKEAERISAALPNLPAIIKYFDEDIEEHVVIRELENARSVQICGNTLRFDEFSPSVWRLFKHAVYYFLRENAPRTAVTYFQGYIRVERDNPNLLAALSGMSPSSARNVWVALLRPQFTSYDHGANARSFLRFCAKAAIGEWNDSFGAFVSELPVPSLDKYKGVEDDSAFIPILDQKKIVDALDQVSRTIKMGETLTFDQLRAYTALLISYSYGTRPTQLARMKVDDVTLTNHGQIRVRYPWIKQNDQGRALWKIQKIKADWAPIVENCVRARHTFPLEGRGRLKFFFLDDAAQIGLSIRQLIERVCGTPYGATMLRHTVAQRMADAGYGLEQIADALCQSDYRTPQVYIQNSASEAHMVNAALGLSPVYQAVIEVAKTGRINKADLMRLPPDNQIGGIPHGIPIAGIGACTRGQSLCAWNPVTSCYTCPEYIAVDDPAVHRDVAESLRPVVMDFREFGRGDTANPAFTQLRRTIEAAEAFADLFEGASTDTDTASLADTVMEAQRAAHEFWPRSGADE